MKFSTTLRMEALSRLGVKLFDVGNLLARLGQMTDRRKRKGRRYALADVLLLVILAKLSGQDRAEEVADWVANRQEELTRVLLLPWSSTPCAMTFQRIIEKAVVPNELAQLVGEFLSEKADVGRSVLVTIDGKSLRGTVSTERPNGEHLLAAYLPDEGIVLMQLPAGDHANEISVAPELLKRIDLRDKVVIGDAMHTQRKLSKQIVDASGDYVWFVKGNQPTLLSDIEQLFESDWRTDIGGRIPTDFETFSTINKGHGRLERRTITLSSMLNDHLDWPEAKQVFRLVRQRTDRKTDKTTTETVYGITSLDRSAATPETLLYFTRRYWAIESLHHCRDTTFREDSCRMTHANAGRVVASLNNLAIGLFRLNGYLNIAKARRQFEAAFHSLICLSPAPSLSC